MRGAEVREFLIRHGSGGEGRGEQRVVYGESHTRIIAPMGFGGMFPPMSIADGGFGGPVREAIEFVGLVEGHDSEHVSGFEAAGGHFAVAAGVGAVYEVAVPRTSASKLGPKARSVNGSATLPKA